MGSIGIEYVLAVACSLAAWVWIASRWIAKTRVLSHAPRRDVPWGPVGLIIALLLIFLKIVAMAIGEDVSTTVSDMDVTTFIWQAVAMGVCFLCVTIGITAVLVMTRGASRQDLGLPSSWSEFAADIRVGLVTCAMSIIPVYGMKIALVNLTDEKVVHPLIEKLKESPNGSLFIVVVFSAVIVAPIFEEFVYRLLLQGWLEKTERPNGDDPADTMPHEPAAFGSHRSWMALPFGMGPIIISALLFSLAHLGHGLDPFPLFILGVLFGYVYYRTHRILPCIIAHMFFNSFSLTLFWLDLAWRH